MLQTVLPQLEKYIIIKCNKNDLKSIIMTNVPSHLKEMRLTLGSGIICRWTTFEPNINLLEQCLYDKTQIIPVSYAWAFHLIIEFVYHPHNDTMDISTYVKQTITENIPKITNEEYTIYNKNNDEYITGNKVIYEMKEKDTIDFYSPELIIETVTPHRKPEYYEMKMWEKIRIDYTPEIMDRIYNKYEMKLEDGTDVMERYKLNNNPFDALIVNTLQFSHGTGGFRYSWVPSSSSSASSMSTNL
jgi:hypothetical protein